MLIGDTRTQMTRLHRDPPGQVLLISSCVFLGRESVPGKAQKTTTYMFNCHCADL